MNKSIASRLQALCSTRIRAGCRLAGSTFDASATRNVQSLPTATGCEYDMLISNVARHHS